MIKKVATSLLWLISLPWCIYTLLAYLIGYTIVWEHWVAGFIMLSIPIAQMGCVMLCLLWLFIRPTRAVLPLVILLVGWPFVLRAVQYSPVKKYKESASDKSVKVLNYNLSAFMIPHDRNNVAKRQALVEYITKFDADIKCFQEVSFSLFLPDKSPLDVLEQKNFYIKNTQLRNVSTLAIFSKYPIIKHGSLSWPEFGTSNGYLYADIALPKDTIRVINMQLQSMGIRVGKVVHSSTYEESIEQGKEVLRSLKRGFIAHANEIKEIERLIDESPYPTLVCGDMNEVPSGLVYGHIRDRLNNAFEEAGNGFGFTLNRSPRWIRIDNQFFSDDFEILNFETHHPPYSDHFPISAVYQLKSKKK